MTSLQVDAERQIKQLQLSEADANQVRHSIRFQESLTAIQRSDVIAEAEWTINRIQRMLRS
jgi:3-hydroxyacyl-CoA dehydrogenase